MSHDDYSGKTESAIDQGLYYYPWEAHLKKLLSPFQEFVHKQTASGILLVIAALTALIFMNSPFHGVYKKIIHFPVTLQVGTWTLHSTLLHMVNDGLMAFFFFVVGLEIKREILVGELADIRKAALPVIAAYGGMLVPAFFYWLVISSGHFARGWGIPMATDIAFCVAALVLLGKRIPEGLMIFLVSLAIVDDIGAVIVIAVFYTKTLNMSAMGMAGVCFCLLLFMNLTGVRRGLPYLIIGLLLWMMILHSGIHATIAGILTAFCIPARAHYDQDLFIGRIKEFLPRFKELHAPDKNILGNSGQQAILHAMKGNIFLAESPVQRMQEALHFPVAILVIPAFAVVNTGIPLGLAELRESITHPVTLAVMLGLLAGKPVGISLFTFLALKSRLAVLPNGVHWKHIVGVGILGGIGFTMSIFIAELSFGNDVALLEMAKTGILLASFSAGVVGYLWLRRISTARAME